MTDSRAGAGTAAHAGGDEHHVRARDLLADLVDGLFGRGFTDLRARAGAEAFGQLKRRAGADAPSPAVARACASVFATMKSTPARPVAIMLLMALQPAPPTPMTVSFGLQIREIKTLARVAHIAPVQRGGGVRCAAPRLSAEATPLPRRT